MWVIKLGGSLMQAPELKSWLETLQQPDSRAYVIVPGGGVFADAVRTAQAEQGFDDAAAHRMAVLAMEQYAWLLKSFCPGLVMVRSVDEILECARQGSVMLWMPARMVLGDPAIPMNWGVTSDSLAAWLAGKLRAERLVLVKHADFSDHPASIGELQAQGILDAAFGEFSSRLGCPIHIFGKSAQQNFRRLLSGSALPALNHERSIRHDPNPT